MDLPHALLVIVGQSRTRQLKWRGWSGERAMPTEMAFQRADEEPPGG